MANSQFYQFTLSKDAALTLLSGSFVAGAAGAVTVLQGSGIASITKLTTGRYQINLDENYAKLLNVNAMTQRSAVGTTSGVLGIEVGSEQVASASAPQVVIQCMDAAGADVDPAVGAKVMFTIVMRNSSAKGKGE